MSSLVVTDEGEEFFLDLVVSTAYTLRLFRNDVTAGLTPDEIDQLIQPQFSEATFPGYVASDITGTSGWTTTQANPSTAVATERTFTRSSTGTAQLIFGYYLTVTGFGGLRWFEQFDAPISMEFINDAINITPTITLDDVKGNAVESGTIVATGRATAPAGWLLCDGSAISRTTFADLFAAIGAAYGVGDGSTTFNLPDGRGRFMLGKADAGTGATLGATGGAIDHVHGLDTPSSHAQIVVSTSAAIFGRRRNGVSSYDTTHTNITSSANTTPETLTVGSALGGNSGTENPPFQTVNFIVKT